MKILKAIEIQVQYSKHLDIAVEPDLVDAMKLGIQALIRLSNERVNPGAYKDLPLPGETVD